MRSPGLVVVVVGVVLFASACSFGADESSAPSVTESATTATTPRPSNSTSTNAADSTTSSSDNAPPEADPFGSVAELRRVLGAATVVARSGDTVVAVGDDGQVEVPDDYPAAFPYHIVTDGAIIDYAGRPVCTGLELLGDFHIIDEIETVDDSLVVTVEDRRALAGEGENGEVDIPRWAYDCERQATVMLPSTSSFELTVETTVQRITTSTGLVLVAEWGHGDTPLRLTTGDGTVVIDESQTAFDYVQSADAQTIYFTSYSGTGAASPPDAVVAVDVATGTERWRLDVAGFVWILDNQLVIEAVDTTTLTDLGDFPGQEVVVVDPATGAELDRFPFDGRLIGLF